MRDKLQTIIDKHSLLSEQLADPEIFNDQKKLTTTAKEHSALEDVVNVGKEYPLCKIEISNKSHPFFTGKQNLVDTAGRIEKFNQKYGKK